MIESLMAALAAEFALDVTFYPAPPSQITAPAVLVIPGDPFLEPETQGIVREGWDVWVVYSVKSPDRGAVDMRDNSLRVMRTVQALGAVWRGASGPRRTTVAYTQHAVSINRVDFKYAPGSPAERNTE